MILCEVMENEKYFLNKIKNIDDSIKRFIEKIDFPYSYSIHIDKTKNINEEVNKLLTIIQNEVPNEFGASILYTLSELTDNIEQHSNYSNAYVFINTKKNILK